MKKSDIAACLALAIGALTATAAPAQTWPSRPVTLIVPAPPGGGTDVFARQLAEMVEPVIKQKLIIENKAGAGGTLGTTQLTAARPDGHTLGFLWNSPLTASPHTLKLSYTPDSYRALMSIGYSSYVLCAQPNFPAANAAEFLAAIKANPGKFTYGNDGVGGTMQLAAERIFRSAGSRVRAIPFAGAGETAKNFLGGHVDFYGGSLPPIIPHVKAGKAKCLLLTSAGDNEALPGARGLDALGMGAQETVLWWGLFAPSGLPDDLAATIEKTFTAAAASPAFKAAMEKLGGVQRVYDGKKTAELLRSELAALGEVAEAIGLRKN